jgi:hypothetical protein
MDGQSSKALLSFLICVIVRPFGRPVERARDNGNVNLSP